MCSLATVRKTVIDKDSHGERGFIRNHDGGVIVMETDTTGIHLVPGLGFTFYPGFLTGGWMSQANGQAAVALL
jgi:hypothetical protein